ncbi:acyltransferase [Ammoniphilus sp. YIM 78166]|uniref:acyltransferase n=1 Tax=Ammoniphilus sp. YIM 78166 TaxID=1644106 RepID=UPI00106F6FF6|nr:acyltransferase [Ammoniphilus sp. YIM 78166]
MNNSIVYPNVVLGKNVVIEDYAIIGVPPQGTAAGELMTVIGDHAIIRSHTVIYAGNRIGDHFQTGHQVTIREHNKIGSYVSIGTGTCIEHHITIENNVRIHSQAFIPEYALLQEGCWIGPNVVLTNAKYPRSANVKASLQGPIIGQNAKIGANSTILPGIAIGANSLVGAGTVVVSNVPDDKVVIGNPGRILKGIDQLDVYLKGEN